MKFVHFLIFVILANCGVARDIVRVTSPDGNIIFICNLDKTLHYTVIFKGSTLIANASVSLHFEDVVFQNNVTYGKPVFRDTTEDYDLVVGKSSHVHTRYKEVSIPMEAGTHGKKIIFIVRAFNDGVAFRYSMQAGKTQGSFTLLDENTGFTLNGDPIIHTLFLPNFLSSHEGYYSHLSFSKIREDTLMDIPTLFEFPKSIYMAITEAALLDYAGMYLTKKNGVLTGTLSPLPNQQSEKVKGILPHVSPWRVLLISDRIGALIESNILTTLCPPLAIKDPAWLRPGKTTFPWWNGNVVPDTLNAPGNNFVTQQYYIDFCSRNNIQYHSVVEYGLHQWYMDDGIGFQPGPHADVTTPVPGLNMKEVCDYATLHNVGIRVWVHWAALYPKLDSAFKIFEQWGLKGMMVDFMDRDDQQMVNIQTEILQKAAQHHLHIQFHGAYRPTGLSRTYPNEFTREGTLNYEVDKWDPNGISPDHDINMPFTRMLAGSTDYHLGGFRAVPQAAFKTQYTRPLVLGTRCHMLAMYVVLENYLQMVCDYPSAYEGQPGFEFIRAIPTTWDQTKVLDARLNEFITVARKKNNEWYVGTITNHQAREVKVSFNFLEPGTYTLELFSDAVDSDKIPDHLLKQTKTIRNDESIRIQIAAGGGMAMKITRN
ncbi:MAG: glycoside hydrolase family 97 protein [Ginsengibacter sp.]